MNEAQPQSTKKLFPKALVGKAKNLWLQAQNNRCSLSKARRALAEFKKYYPEGNDAFMQWYNSPEGLPFRKWITQQ